VSESNYLFRMLMNLILAFSLGFAGIHPRATPILAIAVGIGSVISFWNALFNWRKHKAKTAAPVVEFTIEDRWEAFQKVKRLHVTVTSKRREADTHIDRIEFKTKGKEVIRVDLFNEDLTPSNIKYAPGIPCDLKPSEKKCLALRYIDFNGAKKIRALVYYDTRRCAVKSEWIEPSIQIVATNRL
jgi:hypothetical protein